MDTFLQNYVGSFIFPVIIMDQPEYISSNNLCAFSRTQTIQKVCNYIGRNDAGIFFFTSLSLSCCRSRSRSFTSNLNLQFIFWKCTVIIGSSYQRLFATVLIRQHFCLFHHIHPLDVICRCSKPKFLYRPMKMKMVNILIVPAIFTVRLKMKGNAIVFNYRLFC